jgi:hypothetical protein
MVCSIRSRTSALMLPPRPVRLPMKLQGDTVFIPENQAMRLRNGCIYNRLESEVRVNVEARERRDAGLVYLVCLVFLVYLVYLVR